MSSYIIAGSADKPETADVKNSSKSYYCILIGNNYSFLF